jgi:hypothetical protein
MFVIIQVKRQNARDSEIFLGDQPCHCMELVCDVSETFSFHRQGVDVLSIVFTHYIYTQKC